MIRWSKKIDSAIAWIGSIAGYMILLLVFLVCIDVILRYVFQFSRVWIMELELYLFAFSFLFGAAYALQKEQHVRVDVIYDKLSKRKKEWINLFGGLAYLLPWTLIMMYISWSYFYKSLLIHEVSSQAGGLPFLFIMKLGVFLAFFLLFFQGISQLIKSIDFLRNSAIQNEAS